VEEELDDLHRGRLVSVWRLFAAATRLALIITAVARSVSERSDDAVQAAVWAVCAALAIAAFLVDDLPWLRRRP
jgi:hypothetical protein